MENWYGPVALEKTENMTPPDLEADPGFLPLDESHVKAVHYPDCQQLIIWLPRPGREYGTLQLYNSQSGTLLDEWPVEDKLSGAIQVLWDTLSLEPGSYRVVIHWKKSYQHIIHLKKYKAGESLPVPEVKEAEVNKDSPPIVYRDGTGKILENEDLLLRDQVIRDIAARFGRTVEYQDEGRSGMVFYVEGDTRTGFYYELGGGDCVAWIDIPGPEQWQAVTKIPLERRADIIDFIARQVQARQAPHSRIRITSTAISFMEK